jgi:hypothetical protein
METPPPITPHLTNSRREKRRREMMSPDGCSSDFFIDVF